MGTEKPSHSNAAIVVIIFSYISPDVWESSLCLEMAQGHLEPTHLFWLAFADKFPIVWQSKGFFFENVSFDFLTNMVCSSQEWSRPLSLKELSAEGSCVEPSQEPVNCIYMYLCFLTDSLLAACVGESCEGLLSLPPVFSENTQIVFCVVRATSLALGECILILAPASNRLLISD